MVITITAPAGGNKTKTALELAAMSLKNGKKVVFLTTDSDYAGWVTYIESFCGADTKNFRPVYCSDLNGALHIVPYVDHLPYDVIILDGFSYEIASLTNSDYKSMIKDMLNCTTDKSGKIIITMMQNSL